MDPQKPTNKKLLEMNPASLVLMSHLGRPDGRPNAGMSLRPVAAVLEQHLGGEKVVFVGRVQEGWQDFFQKWVGNRVSMRIPAGSEIGVDHPILHVSHAERSAQDAVRNLVQHGFNSCATALCGESVPLKAVFFDGSASDTG